MRCAVAGVLAHLLARADSGDVPVAGAPVVRPAPLPGGPPGAPGRAGPPQAPCPPRRVPGHLEAKAVFLAWLVSTARPPRAVQKGSAGAAAGPDARAAGAAGAATVPRREARPAAGPAPLRGAPAWRCPRGEPRMLPPARRPTWVARAGAQLAVRGRAGAREHAPQGRAHQGARAGVPGQPCHPERRHRRGASPARAALGRTRALCDRPGCRQMACHASPHGHASRSCPEHCRMAHAPGHRLWHGSARSRGQRAPRGRARRRVACARAACAAAAWRPRRAGARAPAGRADAGAGAGERGAAQGAAGRHGAGGGGRLPGRLGAHLRCLRRAPGRALPRARPTHAPPLLCRPRGGLGMLRASTTARPPRAPSPAGPRTRSWCPGAVGRRVGHAPAPPACSCAAAAPGAAAGAAAGAPTGRARRARRRHPGRAGALARGAHLGQGPVAAGQAGVRAPVGRRAQRLPPGAPRARELSARRAPRALAGERGGARGPAAPAARERASACAAPGPLSVCSSRLRVGRDSPLLLRDLIGPEIQIGMVSLGRAGEARPRARARKCGGVRDARVMLYILFLVDIICASRLTVTNPGD